MKVLLDANGRTPDADAGLRELSTLLEGDMRTWEDNIREAAEARGLAEGRSKGRSEGRTEMLLNMVRHKFSETSAAQMEPMLGTH